MISISLLDQQINRFGYWSAIVVIATIIFSLFLPLDAPGGYSAEHADRVAWLSANKSTFVLGWINQIAALLSLSGVFFGIAWRLANKHPLRAVIATTFVLVSLVAFIIPKFIAVWTIPLLADTITTGATGVALADPLLRILNVSIPFSLYTSFDYLGFWLYAVFGLLIAGPLYGQSISSKIAATVMGIFGIAYHMMVAALVLGYISAPDIEAISMSIFMLLLFPVIAMIFEFKDSKPSVDKQEHTE